MVQGKKQLSSKPKFTEVAIGDNEAKEMRESWCRQKSGAKTEQIASLVRMIFTQKRELVVFSKEERDTIYDKLTDYIDIPDMPLDNSDTERLIRDMVMGKKAYLFCRDLDACKRAAMMYSLFQIKV